MYTNRILLLNALLPNQRASWRTRLNEIEAKYGAGRADDIVCDTHQAAIGMSCLMRGILHDASRRLNGTLDDLEYVDDAYSLNHRASIWAIDHDVTSLERVALDGLSEAQIAAVMGYMHAVLMRTAK